MSTPRERAGADPSPADRTRRPSSCACEPWSGTDDALVNVVRVPGLLLAMSLSNVSCDSLHRASASRGSGPRSDDDDQRNAPCSCSQAQTGPPRPHRRRQWNLRVPPRPSRLRGRQRPGPESPSRRTLLASRHRASAQSGTNSLASTSSARRRRRRCCVPHDGGHRQRAAARPRLRVLRRHGSVRSPRYATLTVQSCSCILPDGATLLRSPNQHSRAPFEQDPPCDRTQTAST